MKIVLQRVSRACVTVAQQKVGEIGEGVVLLVGVKVGDTPEQAQYLADRCAGVRIFEDTDGKMNRSLIDIEGAALVISQFTLLGDTRKGRRPGFTDAAAPETANELYELFIAELKKQVVRVEKGIFGANMQVELVNNGPVTLILER